MHRININFNSELGKIKPLNGVNNGPVKGPRMFPANGNFDLYKAACFPYARNHDASFSSAYGGERTVDINAIFQNFDADPYDPQSYDFVCTDHYTKSILEAGTKVFYRLGNKIDHRVKKYDSLPPKDFKKWAIICEHIIKHYNEGWADGFHLNIEYWEIWNEPENGSECWDAPYEDFFDLFAITAKHLKEKFPNLKIGGPAFATGGPTKRARPFLTYMKEHDVPIDFLSWHCYRTEISEYTRRIQAAREALDECGYPNAENILNEYAYVINWKESLRESILIQHTSQGAAFLTALMSASQNSALDMLMYYDARIGCSLNCLFDFYTYAPMKCYYSFIFFSKLYQLGTQVESSPSEGDIYTVAAKNGKKKAVMITYFTNNKAAEDKEIALTLENAEKKRFRMLLIDKDKNGEEVGFLELKNDSANILMKPNTVLMLETV